MAASRKLYIELAATIKRAREVASTHPVEMSRFAQIAMVGALAESIASDLKVDNVRFDRERFLAACGVPTVESTLVTRAERTLAVRYCDPETCTDTAKH